MSAAGNVALISSVLSNFVLICLLLPFLCKLQGGLKGSAFITNTSEFVMCNAEVCR